MSAFVTSTACVALIQLILLHLVAGKLYSWCDRDLCGPGIRHIACNNNGVRAIEWDDINSWYSTVF